MEVLKELEGEMTAEEIQQETKQDEETVTNLPTPSTQSAPEAHEMLQEDKHSDRKILQAKTAVSTHGPGEHWNVIENLPDSLKTLDRDQ